MPRSSKSRGVNNSVDTLEPDEVEDDVTVDDEDVAEEEDDDEDEATPGFSFESRPAPKDFTPDRKTPGRVRQPSYFDDILRRDDVFGKGWQMVPVTSKEHIKAVLRELNRAKLHLNKPENMAEGDPEIGLDLDVREDAVYYKSRVAQKRERKNGNGAPKGRTEDEDAIDDEEIEDLEDEIEEDDVEDEDEEEEA